MTEYPKRGGLDRNISQHKPQLLFLRVYSWAKSRNGFITFHPLWVFGIRLRSASLAASAFIPWRSPPPPNVNPVFSAYSSDACSRSAIYSHGARKKALKGSLFMLSLHYSTKQLASTQRPVEPHAKVETVKEAEAVWREIGQLSHSIWLQWDICWPQAFWSLI